MVRRPGKGRVFTAAGGIDITGICAPNELKIDLYKLCTYSTGNGSLPGARWTLPVHSMRPGYSLFPV
jgi:hypothetical protein